jgi:hypothetical protein
MLANLIAHQSLILMVLLSVSEVMALVFPNAGGILKAVITGLKAIGAKDQDGQ